MKSLRPYLFAASFAMLLVGTSRQFQAVAPPAPRLNPAAARECPEGTHACNSDWCCEDGYNYFCAYNECDRVKNKCYRAYTDEALYDLRRCCTGGLISCPG